MLLKLFQENGVTLGAGLGYLLLIMLTHYTSLNLTGDDGGLFVMAVAAVVRSVQMGVKYIIDRKYPKIVNVEVKDE